MYKRTGPVTDVKFSSRDQRHTTESSIAGLDGCPHLLSQMSLLIVEWIVKRHLPISSHKANVVTLKLKQQRQDNKNTVTKIDNETKNTSRIQLCNTCSRLYMQHITYHPIWCICSRLDKTGTTDSPVPSCHGVLQKRSKSLCPSERTASTAATKTSMLQLGSSAILKKMHPRIMIIFN